MCQWILYLELSSILSVTYYTQENISKQKNFQIWNILVTQSFHILNFFSIIPMASHIFSFMTVKIPLYLARALPPGIFDWMIETGFAKKRIVDPSAGGFSTVISFEIQVLFCLIRPYIILTKIIYLVLFIFKNS